MIGTGDDQLSKFPPLPLSTLSSDHEIHEVRKSFFYIYVVNWLSNHKAYLRLSSEYFDIDLFEMELLNLFNPPPLDESVLFLSKLKVSIVNQISGSRDMDFDDVIKKSFIGTPLESSHFDNLSLIDKFEVFYVILDHFSGLSTFRSFIEKNDLPTNFQILNTEVSDNVKTEWFLIIDKLYKRTITYPNMNVPLKRKDSPEDPETFFVNQFDISLQQMTFDIEVWSLDDYNKFIPSLKKSTPFKHFKTLEFQDFLVGLELKRRKNITNKKKEYQLINLMATRKKSSRLQAKELERETADIQTRSRREQEFRKALDSGKVNKRLNYNGSLSREDRLKARNLNTAFFKGETTPEE
ncbi:hypothetical protein CLIB1444_04S04896 [[Candida] jaroonii]|uniref:Uncharacterized protein n=1 Tax=[Candida] jaroonii TaxID=467808 RepID=A0ACA9Y7F0_9ASCO|nr:hypothetical protein CLIB1444_04S04896 [[Candida] jaroonii]